MSKISDIFDALNNNLQAEFPSSTYYYLVNPYIPEENDELKLKRGLGFFIGGANNNQRTLSCFISISRTITVTQTIKQLGTHLDSNLKDTATKTLLEDQHKLIKLFEAMPQESSNGIDKFIFLSDNGIEFVFGNGDETTENFLMLRSQFELEYLENIGA
jgi:hypothetical protein